MSYERDAILKRGIIQGVCELVTTNQLLGVGVGMGVLWCVSGCSVREVEVR